MGLTGAGFGGRGVPGHGGDRGDGRVVRLLFLRRGEQTGREFGRTRRSERLFAWAGVTRVRPRAATPRRRYVYALPVRTSRASGRNSFMRAPDNQRRMEFERRFLGMTAGFRGTRSEPPPFRNMPNDPACAPRGREQRRSGHGKGWRVPHADRAAGRIRLRRAPRTAPGPPAGRKRTEGDDYPRLTAQGGSATASTCTDVDLRSLAHSRSRRVSAPPPGRRATTGAR